MKELQVKCQAVAVGKGIFEMQGIKIQITRLSISRAKKINKLNSQTDFKEVSSFCKNCAFVPAWVSCISCFYFQHANQGMHFAYCKLLWSIIHGRDSIYVSFSLRGHGLLRTSHRDFLNLQNFLFLPPVSIKVDIYFGLFQEVLRRQRGSCSFCIIAGTPWNCTYWQLE